MRIGTNQQPLKTQIEPIRTGGGDSVHHWAAAPGIGVLIQLSVEEVWGTGNMEYAERID